MNRYVTSARQALDNIYHLRRLCPEFLKITKPFHRHNFVRLDIQRIIAGVDSIGLDVLQLWFTYPIMEDFPLEEAMVIHILIYKLFSAKKFQIQQCAKCLAKSRNHSGLHRRRSMMHRWYYMPAETGNTRTAYSHIQSIVIFPIYIPGFKSRCVNAIGHELVPYSFVVLKPPLVQHRRISSIDTTSQFLNRLYHFSASFKNFSIYQCLSGCCPNMAVHIFSPFRTRLSPANTSYLPRK